MKAKCPFCDSSNIKIVKRYKNLSEKYDVIENQMIYCIDCGTLCNFDTTIINIPKISSWDIYTENDFIKEVEKALNLFYYIDLIILSILKFVSLNDKNMCRTNLIKDIRENVLIINKKLKELK